MAQTIIVADDHPLFRAALKQAVSQAVPDAETVEVDSIKALQAAVESHPDADLILLDLNMPGAHGFSGLVFMRGQYPGLPVVVVSGSEDLQVMRRSIDYGASGFIPKSHGIDVIREAISEVMSGNMWTPPDVDLGADVLKKKRRQRKVNEKRNNIRSFLVSRLHKFLRQL